MRVWIVNPFDNLPLEGTRPQRYWLLARAFVRAGHEVVLWSSDFSHARKRPRQFVADDVRAPGFRLELVQTPSYPRNICLRRIWSHRRFARNWLARAAREAPPDVLVTSVPPLALGTAAADYVRACPRAPFWIADVQDAWPETFERVAPRCLLAPLRRVARRIYRGANAVVGVAERYVELARAAGATSPMRVFRLAIARDGWAEREREARDDGTFRLAYAGMMGRSYDLETVLAAVKEEPAWTLNLAGGGPEEARLRARAADCDRIRFHGYLGDAELHAFLMERDAGVVPMFDDACVGVPGKLADYLAAGLPVLNSLSGETARLLTSAGAGESYAAGDLADFRAAAARLRAGLASARVGARNLSNAFDADSVYGDYVGWVENLVHYPPGDRE